ncbi:DUF4186 domain-containing protein [Erwinia sorbitola]|uniref:DUF4186 family protein n=1 Tax=Erwinia sorbitola TaxID=2681984 RepID=A0ABW9RA51_9GAMM|nr:DUF4186 domain-containing protein [Erwinia sorbitola]MTD26932.1 DUF4186 family protein [Erwinia sorbitola]
MHSLDDLFLRLSRSPFRQRFHLGLAEYRYCRDKGEEIIRQHAAEFIRERLAPAEPVNDGKQTPMRGHPVFIAQHATGTCCRGCLSKWHAIPTHQAISSQQQQWINQVILRWLHHEMQRPQPLPVPAKKPPEDKSGQLELL